MQDFNIYKKKDGGLFKKDGSIYASSFDEAKVEFAVNCYNNLMNGIHGDNYIALSEISDNVDEDGIYIEGELFMSNSDLHEGIESFNEDVYTWVLKDNFDVEITDNNGNIEIDTFDSDSKEDALKEAKEMYPSEDGYSVKNKV